MSKYRARRKNKKNIKPEPKVKRKAVILVCGLLCLTLAVGIMAQWRARLSTSTLMAAAPAPTGSFAATSPSKEYVYAGGRLIATEEPAVASATPTPTPSPTPTPTPTPTPPSGGYHSLLLNGSTAYVNVSPGINITGPITVEAWFKTNSSSTDQAIAARVGPGPATDGGFELMIYQGKLAFYTLQNGSAGDGIYGTTAVSPNVWHHAAGVFDGSQLRVYLDGVLDGSKASTVAPSTGTRDLQIGGYLGAALYYPFNGQIDEVRISDSAIYTTNFTPQAHLPVVPNVTKRLWNFDEGNVADYASGNNGLPQGNADFSTDVPEDLSYNSLSVGATGSYVEVPNSTSLNITGPMTAEAWVKINTTTYVQSVVSRFGAYPATDGGYALYIENGKPVFYTLKNGSEADSVIGSTVLTTNTWHHVAGVFDGSQLRVYLDGALVGSKTSTYAPVSGTTNLYIGAMRYASSTIYQLDGLIDEVRISSAALYSGSSFTPQSHPVAADNNTTKGLWKFDGQRMADSSNNGNTGVLTGSATYSTNTP